MAGIDHAHVVHLVQVGFQVTLVRRSDDDQHPHAGTCGQRVADIRGHAQVARFPVADVAASEALGGRFLERRAEVAVESQAGIAGRIIGAVLCQHALRGAEAGLQRLVVGDALVGRRILPGDHDGIHPALAVGDDAVGGVVVHRVHLLVPEPCRQRRGQEVAFVAGGAQLFEKGDQLVVQAVASVPFGDGQAQPLHQARRPFATRQEHGCQLAPLGSTWLRRPGSQQLLGARGGCRHVQAGCRLRRGRVPAVVGNRIGIACRIAAHVVALRTGQRLDRDAVRTPAGQPVFDRAQGGRVEGLGQGGQVGRAEHHYFIGGSRGRAFQGTGVKIGPVGLCGGAAGKSG